MLRIGIVAGEASGDYLAANLIESIRRRQPDIQLEGIGGPQLKKAGCRTLFPMERLSVMGLVEVLVGYRELWRIRRRLIQHFTENPPHVFVGVDAPDFNLGLERALRRQGIRTVHYVSPSVWAWRSYRIKKIAAAVDLMLTLFPFDQRFYEKHGLPVRYVGHPLAEKADLTPDRAAARQRLALPEDKNVIALMPGSRRGELKRLLPVFLQAAARLEGAHIHFVSSLLTKEAVLYCQEQQAKLSLEALPLSFYQDRTADVLAAADLALLASGTVTLEAMLYRCPMVVAYRLHWLTHKLVLALADVRQAALPNFLAGELLVPECLQGECHPKRLAQELQQLLDNPALRLATEDKFSQIHHELRMNSSEQAASAVLELLDT